MSVSTAQGNDEVMLAISNHGSKVWLKGRHPRKELCEALNRRNARKIYRDKRDGTTVHCGYIVAGEWWNLFVPYEKVVK